LGQNWIAEKGRPQRMAQKKTVFKPVQTSEMSLEKNRKTIVLASQSPRRAQLLSEAGFTLTIVPADIDETPVTGEGPVEMTVRLAAEKAEAVATRHPYDMVLGADTTVIVDGEPLGKPVDLDDARGMLRRLSGREHRVVTGVALIRNHPDFRDVWFAETRVRFRNLTSEIIESYLSLVHTLDKAGAYGIQDHGDLIVQEICGLRSTVVGLPVEEVVERLRVHFSE
jgi:septum formation protein